MGDAALQSELLGEESALGREHALVDVHGNPKPVPGDNRQTHVAGGAGGGRPELRVVEELRDPLVELPPLVVGEPQLAVLLLRHHLVERLVVSVRVRRRRREGRLRRLLRRRRERGGGEGFGWRRQWRVEPGDGSGGRERHCLI